jgi:hypothetical protein
MIAQLRNPCRVRFHFSSSDEALGIMDEGYVSFKENDFSGMPQEAHPRRMQGLSKGTALGGEAGKPRGRPVGEPSDATHDGFARLVPRHSGGVPISVCPETDFSAVKPYPIAAPAHAVRTHRPAPQN